MAHYHLFDLAGEHVYPAHNEHIVRPAHHPRQANVLATAGTVALHNAGEVAGAVADDGHRGPAEGAQHQFAHLPYFCGLKGVGSIISTR